MDYRNLWTSLILVIAASFAVLITSGGTFSSNASASGKRVVAEDVVAPD